MDEVLKEFQEYAEHFGISAPQLEEIDYPVTGINPAIEEEDTLTRDF